MMLSRSNYARSQRSGFRRAAAAIALLAALADPTTRAQDQDPVMLVVGRSMRLTAPWPVKGVSITDPDVADVEVLTPQLVLLRGKSQGTTDLTLWDEKGTTWVRPVAVRHDLAALQPKLDALLPGCQVKLAQSGKVLVLSGTLRRADQAVQLRAFMDAMKIDYVDTTTVPGVQQVQVKVRMAEVSRAGARALGINAFATGSDAFGASLIGSSSGGAINPVSIGPPDGAVAGNGVPFVFNSDVNVTPAVTLFGGFPSANLEVFLRALAEDQFLRVLAEPTLIALSGKQASFLAGGEFPIPVVQGGGAGSSTSVTIEYKEFGVGLKFRPIVLGESRIRLEVASEVSELTDIGAVEIQGFRVPAVVTRRAETTLEMNSGQTFAMAGLINERTNADVAKIPILGSLPIIGTFFRSVRYSHGETELVVMVTVDLVEPLSKVHLPPLPGTMHLSPDDWELYTQGRIEGKAPARIGAESAAWLKELGLDGLHGPGAWTSHGSKPPIARGSR
jgi:pilus assembly protein CpaC